MYEAIPRASALVMSQPILPSWWQHTKLKIRLWFARAACRQLGHLFTRRAWRDTYAPYHVAEYHCGCLRCDILWTETPTYKRKTEPRFLFAGPRLTLKNVGDC